MYDPFGKDKAIGFEKAIAPKDKNEKEGWQASNKNWWESYPMRYDHRLQSIGVPEFSSEFYDEVDRRFLESVRIGFPWTKIPFDQFIDFDSLASKDVLEIGVGCGTHAQLLNERAHSYTGIDLTNYAVGATTKRLEERGLNGTVIRMDAEQLSFPDASFDLVWSWGVIHHSSDTKAIIRQIHRVLRVGGSGTVMVYHQSPWNTFIRGWLYYGLIKGGLFKGNNAHRLIQLNTDGALARYYTTSEFISELGSDFKVSHVDYLGSKLQLIPLKYGRLKELVSKLIPNSFGRWLTNRPFFAYMIVVHFTKIR